MNESTINAYIHKNMPRSITRPPNIKYKTLPLDVLRMKAMHNFRVLKADEDEVKRSLLFPSLENKALYGFDSKIVSDIEDLTPYNSILHVLCYMNRLFTDGELDKFLTRFIIPFSGTFFSETSLSSKFAGDYLFEPADTELDISLFEPYDAHEKQEASDSGEHKKPRRKRHRSKKAVSTDDSTND